MICIVEYEILILGNSNGLTEIYWIKYQKRSSFIQYHQNLSDVTIIRCLNNNRERLITICEQNELKILNGYFQHKEIHKYTWRRDTRNQKSIVDYCIVKQKSQFKFLDVRVYRGPTSNSGHHLLRTKAWFKGIKNMLDGEDEQKQKIEQKQYNLNLLAEESVRYRRRLDEKLQGNTTFENLEEHYLYTKNCIHDTVLEALGIYECEKKAQRPYWWVDEIEADIEDKRRKHLLHICSNKPEDKLAYKEAQKKVRQKLAKKKNRTWETQYIHINT